MSALEQALRAVRGAETFAPLARRYGFPVATAGLGSADDVDAITTIESILVELDAAGALATKLPSLRSAQDAAPRLREVASTAAAALGNPEALDALVARLRALALELLAPKVAPPVVRRKVRVRLTPEQLEERVAGGDRCARQLEALCGMRHADLLVDYFPHDALRLAVLLAELPDHQRWRESATWHQRARISIIQSLAEHVASVADDDTRELEQSEVAAALHDAREAVVRHRIAAEVDATARAAAARVRAELELA